MGRLASPRKGASLLARVAGLSSGVAEIDEVRWTASDEPLPDDVAPLLRWLVAREA